MIELWDSYTKGKQNLLKYFVRSETNSFYIRGTDDLKSLGYQILAIVCDDRKGLIQTFSPMPVKMCPFHHAAIIRRYLTKKPKLKAAQELMAVLDLMKQTDKESFEGALNQWYEDWISF